MILLFVHATRKAGLCADNFHQRALLRAAAAVMSRPARACGAIAIPASCLPIMQAELTS
jgi:hypothetical protein